MSVCQKASRRPPVGVRADASTVWTDGDLVSLPPLPCQTSQLVSPSLSLANSLKMETVWIQAFLGIACMHARTYVRHGYWCIKVKKCPLSLCFLMFVYMFVCGVFCLLVLNVCSFVCLSACLLVLRCVLSMSRFVCVSLPVLSCLTLPWKKKSKSEMIANVQRKKSKHTRG